jgi:dTDP-4-amino-4,6-dideoxygalactose transaminase
MLHGSYSTAMTRATFELVVATSSTREALAITGGTPVRSRSWPAWPIATDRTLQYVAEALVSGRWAISGPYRGTIAFERRFAAAFAAYCDTQHCVPTSSGTASLSIALEAAGVGAGDEVIVPGLSWVASASAVVGINAVPVLCDVDREHWCLDPAAAARAITQRTRAITVVHLYSAVADLAPLLAIAQRHGIPLIEDCAQAHGARHLGRPVGGHGALGAFSMQHSKLLTCGEGGAVVCNDRALADRLEQLRADGRRYLESAPADGQMELEEVGAVFGSNRCLSEIHAAILLDQLAQLDAQNAVRAARARLLDGLLAELGCRPQATAPGTTARTYYQYAFELPPALLARIDVATAARALTAELGLAIKPSYRPLDDHPLYVPERSRRCWSAEYTRRIAPRQFALPIAHAIHDRAVTFGHAALLADDAAMYDIAAAVDKLLRLAPGELPCPAS